MDTAIKSSETINLRSIVIVSLLSVFYLLISIGLVGYKSDQLVLIFIFNLLFYLSSVTRKFILGFSIFIVYWIIFDYMKAFPNYNYHAVHIADLYNLEKHLFGIRYHGQLLTANEYWKINGKTSIDIMAGIFYLCWVPVPLAFAGFLFFRNKKMFLYFSLTFFLVNFIGFIIYYLYPAAPPWYIQTNGFVFHPHTPGNTGGLAKFDQFFHRDIFKSIYSKGSNVFAAMPSLHSSYPVIVLYYGLKNRLGIINVFFAIVMIGIWFTAIYASHHYILDVIAGVLCAVLSIAFFNFLATRVNSIKSFLNNYENLIR